MRYTNRKAKSQWLCGSSGNKLRSERPKRLLVANREQNTAGTNLFEVERINARRVIDGKRYYHLKWTGYPYHESTWEPEENLENCKSLLEAFEIKRANKRRWNDLNGDESSGDKKIPDSSSALSEDDVRDICRDGALDCWPTHWEPDFIQYPVDIDGEIFYIVKLKEEKKGIPKGCLIDGNIFKSLFPSLVVNGLINLSGDDQEMKTELEQCAAELNDTIIGIDVLREWPSDIAADRVELEGIHKEHGDIFLVAAKKEGLPSQTKKLIVIADAFKVSHPVLVADYYESLLKSLKCTCAE